MYFILKTNDIIAMSQIHVAIPQLQCHSRRDVYKKKYTIESSLLLEKHSVYDMSILVQIVLLSNNNEYIPSEFETVTSHTVVTDTAFNRI